MSKQNNTQKKTKLSTRILALILVGIMALSAAGVAISILSETLNDTHQSESDDHAGHNH